MPDYIIVQAGGKGTRLEHLTANKPKALLPVDNLPMLFHLFKKFPESRFVIIADYKKDVLKGYLEAFSGKAGQIKYVVVDANGEGTCAGLKTALRFVPEGSPFLYIWSDLILAEGLKLPEESRNYVGISGDFECRWSFNNGEFSETRSKENGVAGFFIFTDKSLLKDVPESGEFVRFLASCDMTFSRFVLTGTKEFGLISEYEKLDVMKCRPFNKVTIDGDLFIKEPLDKQGRELAEKEISWYKTVKGIKNIPEIHSFEPLIMTRIRGKNIFEYENLSDTKKADILKNIVTGLKEIHNTGSQNSDLFSVYNAYYGKTIERLDGIRGLIPFSDRREITINGRACKNVFFHTAELAQAVIELDVRDFCVIHGDCTFSNIMLNEEGEPVFIDPRGYFGYTKIFGDKNYDYAKLYYSIVGNYDRFNRKQFRLKINSDNVNLTIESNGFEQLEPLFWELTGADKHTVKLIHAIIWLSLTTYAWEDYDSVCAAFYNGLYYLQEVL
jgi:GTP:adenosylcobinamide-phosphate guanylyltransferase